MYLPVQKYASQYKNIFTSTEMFPSTKVWETGTGQILFQAIIFCLYWEITGKHIFDRSWNTFLYWEICFAFTLVGHRIYSFTAAYVSGMCYFYRSTDHFLWDGEYEEKTDRLPPPTLPLQTSSLTWKRGQ